MAIETNPDISSLTRHAAEVAKAQAELHKSMAAVSAEVAAARATALPVVPAS